MAGMGIAYPTIGPKPAILLIVSNSGHKDRHEIERDAGVRASCCICADRMAPAVTGRAPEAADAARHCRKSQLDNGLALEEGIGFGN